MDRYSPDVTKIVKRAVRAAMFDRRPFNEAFFDDAAAADGAILALGVGAITYLAAYISVFGGDGVVFAIPELLGAVFAMVITWLIVAVATWFVATRVFGASVGPQTMMGLHGLAVLPLLLEPVGYFVAPGLARLLSGIGLLWYLAVLAIATQEATDLPLRKAAVSMLIGFALVILVRAILQVPFALFGG